MVWQFPQSTENVTVFENDQMKSVIPMWI